jgi:hypothetical protein
LILLERQNADNIITDAKKKASLAVQTFSSVNMFCVKFSQIKKNSRNEDKNVENIPKSE